MRAHRGRPAPSVLLAGDSADLPELHALIATLPADAYGQVLIEVDVARQIEALALPPRVGVTWLIRGAEAVSARGALLAAAMDAWITEWLPAGHWDCRRIAWVGCAAAPAIADRYRALQEVAAAAPALGLPSVGVDDAE